MNLNERLESELQKRRDLNALRELKVIHDKVDFSSNDYLGFARNEDLKHRIFEGISGLRRLGAGGSRLLTGNHSLIEKTEEEIATFHQSRSALFFNSGYEANAGLIATLAKRNDTILYDELIHASLREGIRLSNANAFSFEHNNTKQLEKKLVETEGVIFIIAESVYSMDGDICPLQEILSLAEQYNAHLILDEAHATGVLGECGEGLAQSLQLHDRIFARVHTFGKAIGLNGAVVLGSEQLRQYLINFCRPFIYTTAPNLMLVLAVREAYRFLQENPHFITQLNDNCRYFTDKCRRFKRIHLLPSQSAIFSILMPGNDDVKLASVYLSNAGYDVRPILSPTVPSGKERLRICMHSYNTKREIDRLLKLLDQFLELNHREKEGD